jgi:hypothetical protein
MTWSRQSKAIGQYDQWRQNGTDVSDDEPTTQGRESSASDGERRDSNEARLSHLTTLLHAGRAANLRHNARGRWTEITPIRASTASLLTAPLRITVDLLRGRIPRGLPARRLLRRTYDVASEHGVLLTTHMIIGYLHRSLQRRSPHASTKNAEVVYGRGIGRPAEEILSPRVVILAALQRTKYRVWRQQEHFDNLGLECRLVDWRNVDESRSVVQLATMVILYQVPDNPRVLSLIEECRRLRVPTYWAADDPIRDEARYRQNRNFGDTQPQAPSFGARRHSAISPRPPRR